LDWWNIRRIGISNASKILCLCETDLKGSRKFILFLNILLVAIGNGHDNSDKEFYLKIYSSYIPPLPKNKLFSQTKNGSFIYGSL